MKFYFLLCVSSLCAAFGQIFLKKGASAVFNLNLYLGLFLYVLGFLLWIYCLSKVSLTIVYAFTLLTFIIVFILANLFFGEKISLYSMIGILFIFFGFLLIVKGQSSV